MDIEERDSHCSDHRQDHDSDKKSGYKKKRTAELTENGDHKGHIAAETKNTRIIFGKDIKIHHLIDSVDKEKHTENNAQCKNQEGNSLPSEMLGKQKIVKHNNSINSFQLSISNSLPVCCKTKHPAIG